MTQLATQSNTQVQKKDPRSMTIRERLESKDFADAIATVMPKHLTPDRFVRVAILAMTRTPKLAECDKASFFNALMTLSQYGIEPDGRRAHLIPFRNNKRNVTECQLIIDYKGLAELAMRSGLVSNIHADRVCENDIFEYDRGEVRKHIIHWKKPRGDAYAYYCLVRFKDGSEKADVMSLEEVAAIRRRSKSGNNGPWVTDFDEMAKKTVFRRLSKWLVLSPEFRDAVEKDDDDFEGSVVEASESAKAMLPSEGLASIVGFDSESDADQGDESTREETDPSVGGSPTEEPAASGDPAGHQDASAVGDSSTAYTVDHEAAATWASTEAEAYTLLTSVQGVTPDLAKSALGKAKLNITGVIDARRAGKELRANLLNAIVAGQFDTAGGKILA